MSNNTKLKYPGPGVWTILCLQNCKHRFGCFGKHEKINPNERGGSIIWTLLLVIMLLHKDQKCFWIHFIIVVFAKSNKGFKQKQVSSLLLTIALHVTWQCWFLCNFLNPCLVKSKGFSTSSSKLLLVNSAHLCTCWQTQCKGNRKKSQQSHFHYTQLIPSKPAGVTMQLFQDLSTFKSWPESILH